MTYLIRMLAAVALAGSIAMPAVGGNLIRNGSFEIPPAPDGGGVLFSPGQSFKGWQVVGNAQGNVGVDSGDIVYCGHNFPARRGKQWLDLTGTTDNGVATGVQQSIRTTPGSTYTLSLYVGNVVDTGNICGNASTVNVLIDGQPFATFTNSDDNGMDQDWKKFSAQFVASNRSTTIALINGDPAGDADNGIDGVSVTLVTTR